MVEDLALIGVINGPLEFLTACKILPLLDLLAKFKRSARLLVLPKFSQFLARSLEIFLNPSLGKCNSV